MKIPAARTFIALIGASSAFTVYAGYKFASAVAGITAAELPTTPVTPLTELNVATQDATLSHGEMACLPGDGLIANRSFVLYRKGMEKITTRERIVVEQVFNKLKPEISDFVTKGNPNTTYATYGQPMLEKFNDGVKAKLGYGIGGYEFTINTNGPIPSTNCTNYSRTEVTKAPAGTPYFQSRNLL